MSLFGKSLDYTDKDHDALTQRLYALLRSVFPEWTDRNVANFGNILLESFAFVGDVVGYYQDNQAGESRIATATQRKNLIALCKLLSFSPSTASAATVDVTISIEEVTAGDVSIEAGTIVRTSEITDPLTFQLLHDAVIPTGETSVSASVEHSENANDSFTSTGLPNQTYLLGQAPYLDNSAVVIAGNGVYVQVDNFLDSTPTDRHYTASINQDDRARIRFGNGVSGAIPIGTISSDYKVGGGDTGNVDQGAIDQIDGNFTDSLGNAVTLTVTNPLAATGGAPRMSNELIKASAPATIRAPTNSVAREDFVINVMRLPAVARALMLTSNEDIGIAENTGNLHIIPVGGGYPSAELKAQALAQVTAVYPCTLTFLPSVRDPLYKAINVLAVVYLRAGYSRATTRALITRALTDFFKVSNGDGTPNLNVDFGGNLIDDQGGPDPTLAWSDIANVVRDVSAVRKIDASVTGFLLNGVRADVTLLSSEFPQLGSITLIDGATSESF